MKDTAIDSETIPECDGSRLSPPVGSTHRQED